MLMALVLPAPLGPSSPNTSPRLIARLRHSTATFGGFPPCVWRGAHEQETHAMKVNTPRWRSQSVVITPHRLWAGSRSL